MTDNNYFQSLLSELEKLDKSKDYLTISKTLTRPAHLQINNIITKWISSNDTLTNEEKKFFNLYSSLQLSFVEYCVFNSDTKTDVQTIIDDLPVNLFQKAQTDTLAKAVEYIHSEDFNNTDQNDTILISIMRMIDARSYAYRLCSKELTKMPPRLLNDEICECLTHSYAKNYLYDVKSINDTHKNISINNHHKFFLGCCTYAVASYDENKDYLKKPEDNKYIYLLAKYIRTMLNMKDFEKDKSILYCLRGILALLTNCVPINNWIHIINKALANVNDDDAQLANPFNIEFFSLIIHRLLGSDILQDQAIQLNSYTTTSLIDIALIFLNKWFDTSSDLNDNDDDDNNDRRTNETNQVLRLLGSDEEFNKNKSTSQVIIPYINAKYDRLRLMAISTLSALMNKKDFDELHKYKVDMAQDIVKLLFHFIDRAIAQEDQRYKGISYERLFCYLLRFLVQDSVKEQTLPYISKIINYAKNRHSYALKILRRMSTNPKIQNDLLKDGDLERFLKIDADNLYGPNSKLYKYIENIRQNLTPIEQKESPTSKNIEGRQAFISYCHKDKDRCSLFHQTLKENNLFTKIWIDNENMKDNMIDTITEAINQSEIVFVLLSDAYCKSDVCRCEWTFARSKKRKIYPIFVQESFKKDSCDWVWFYLGDDFYYRINKDDDLKRLIKELKTNNDKLQSQKKISNDIPELSLASTIERDNYQDNIENPKKETITSWTSEDIQKWCRTNGFEQWCEPLAKYDGQSLLELNRILKTDDYLNNFAINQKITIFEVIRFKCELDKLVAGSTRITTHKPKTKKDLAKRRASKSSTK
ncbi:unnamed protein product [Adineta steineri]|uniref:TIR domain-containing protein n=1 Tax=Adineta steineri TaxID=433720 RepID=A0A814GXC3_9BILA|nr:unnamed protein product [Adineta steineri]CAF3496748.1 unnamed protein product [Adineta steineri]